MLLINRIYSEVTPESAEDGELSDSGFICENAEYTFRELVDLLKDHPEQSNSGHPSQFTLCSTGYSVDDYSTMTEREETVHFSRDNAARKLKYWVKAIDTANRWK